MRILDPRELFAPGGLVGGGHTSQGRFELCLTIRLRVKAGGETDLSPKGGAEFPPDAGSELRTSVGHNISGDPMETEDVGCQELGGLQSCGKLREGDKAYSFRKMVNYGDNNCVT